MNQTSRQTWIDTLRLCAGVSMVGLHCTSDPMGKPFPDFEVGERIVPMLFRAIVYTARTELFIIIALFLLLSSLDNRQRSYAATIQEQGRKLLVPFAFWTIFFAAFNLIKASQFGYLDSMLAEIQMPSTWVQYLTLGSVKYHMHFIPTLFLILLAYPIFRVATKMPWLGLLILLGLAAKQQVDAYIWSTYYDDPWLGYYVRATKVVAYIGYGLVAGSLLWLWTHASQSKLQHLLFPLIWAGVILFAFKLISTWKTITTGAWVFDYSPAYWADFLMPVILFSICMCLADKSWPNVFTKLAPYSFGLYLTHPIFLDLFEIATQNLDVTPSLLVPMKFTWAMLLSGILVLGLSRFRLLSWTIGFGSLPKLRSLFPNQPSEGRT